VRPSCKRSEPVVWSGSNHERVRSCLTCSKLLLLHQQPRAHNCRDHAAQGQAMCPDESTTERKAKKKQRKKRDRERKKRRTRGVVRVVCVCVCLCVCVRVCVCVTCVCVCWRGERGGTCGLVCAKAVSQADKQRAVGLWLGGQQLNGRREGFPCKALCCGRLKGASRCKRTDNRREPACPFHTRIGCKARRR
jgi:hypothetical protein